MSGYDPNLPHTQTAQTGGGGSGHRATLELRRNDVELNGWNRTVGMRSSGTVVFCSRGQADSVMYRSGTGTQKIVEVCDECPEFEKPNRWECGDKGSIHETALVGSDVSRHPTKREIIAWGSTVGILDHCAIWCVLDRKTGGTSRIGEALRRVECGAR